jgi:hypothetical protein
MQDSIEAVKIVEKIIERNELDIEQLSCDNTIDRLEEENWALRKVLSHANHDIYC